jgi:hypothetical protein
VRAALRGEDRVVLRGGSVDVADRLTVRVRPVFLPLLPYLSESHEPNFRTYVHLDGMPGM